MATWPAALVITRDGFKESPPDLTIRSNMENGEDKVRRRSTSGPRPLSLSLFLDAAGVDILDDFYVEETASGSLKFLFVHPRTGATVNARFKGPPEWMLRETMYDVSVELEIVS